MAYLLILVLFIWVLVLQGRVSTLEKGGQSNRVESSVPAAAAYQAPVPVRAPVAPAEPSFDVFAWFKEDWLLKLGIMLVIIGLGWFVSYAFANNWIGPMGRITLGLVASTTVLAFGWWRMVKKPAQGGSFMALGAIGIIMTTIAAREIYGFFTPFSALGIIFVSLVFVTLASVQFRRLPLTLVGLILAGIAPFLAHVDTLSIEGLFLYLLIVITGMLWAVVYTGWRELVLASLIVVGFYSMTEWVGSEQSYFALGIAWLLSLMFFVSHTLGVTRKENSSTADLWTAFLNGALVFGWTIDQVKEEWQVLALVAWALVFVIGAFIVHHVTSRKAAFFIYGGIGAVLIGAATALQLEGQIAVLTIAFIVEALVFIFGAFMITNDVGVAKRAAWILLVPGALSFMSVADTSAWRAGPINEHFFVLLLMSAALFLLGFFFHSYRQAGEADNTHQALYVIGSIYAYVLIWLALHAGNVLPSNIATMTSLVIYTLAGLASYAYGRLENAKGLVTYGGALLVFVVGRLLIVDVWQMELAARVITFFLIGALLISTAFIGRGKHQAN